MAHSIPGSVRYPFAILDMDGNVVYRAASKRAAETKIAREYSRFRRRYPSSTSYLPRSIVNAAETLYVERRGQFSTSWD